VDWSSSSETWTRSLDTGQQLQGSLAAARDRLARELGVDDPRVVELSERHEFISGLHACGAG
jgi:hypothetical protein